MEELLAYAEEEPDSPDACAKLEIEIDPQNGDMEIQITRETPRSSSANVFKTTCTVCEQNPSKYRCPGCKIAYCSLLCYAKHKVTNNCEGKLNRSAHVPVSAFTDAQLKSDIIFLEEVDSARNRGINKFPNLKKKTYKRKRKSNTRDSGGDSDTEIVTILPIKLKKLVEAAKQRNITLQIMPNVMAKRKSNTTYFNVKKKNIFWRIEWSFMDSALNLLTNQNIANNNNDNDNNNSNGNSNRIFFTPRANEDIFVGELLLQCINAHFKCFPNNNNKPENNVNNDMGSENNKVLVENNTDKIHEKDNRNDSSNTSSDNIVHEDKQSGSNNNIGNHHNHAIDNNPDNSKEEEAPSVQKNAKRKRALEVKPNPSPLLTEERLSTLSSNVVLLIRQEQTPANIYNYYKVNPRNSLNTSLEHMVVTEYPTIIIIPETQKDKFHIIEKEIPTISTNT